MSPQMRVSANDKILNHCKSPSSGDQRWNMGNLTNIDVGLSMADSNPLESEILSKNALKKQLKNHKKEEKKNNKNRAAKLSPEDQKTKTRLATEEAADPNQTFENRLKFLDMKKAAGINRYPHKFCVTMSITEFIEEYGGLNFGECLDDGQASVSLAGRIISKRLCSPKLIFYDLRGGDAEVQVVTNAGTCELEEAEFSNLHSCVKCFDIVGVTGFPGKTKRGQLSIFAKSFVVLSHCLQVIPIQSLKKTGQKVWVPGNIRNPDLYILNDVETRYNQRFLDLMLNDEVRQVFKTRSKVIRYIRKFLDNMEFLEVETPIMNNKKVSGGAAPFITNHNELNMKLYMRTTPHLYLKQLLIGGLDRVYEIGKQFSNDGSHSQNPEYTTCSSYMSYADYNDMMELAETLLSGMVKELTGSFVIKCHSDKALVDINFTPPFRRINVIEELEKVTNLSIPKDLTSEEANRYLRDACAKYNVQCTPPLTTARLLDELVAHFLKQTCVNPTFFMDHPDMAKCHRSKTEYSELLVNKHAICYTYSEHSMDPQTETGDRDRAVEYGLPPCASWELGIDNLAMLLTDSQSIQEVLLFPFMNQKPLPQPQVEPQQRHDYDSPLSVRVVVVGDIHEDWALEQDLKALHFLHPDLVMFTGDFGNENVDLVKSISNLNFPKAAILGNHDSWSTSKFSNKVKDGVQLQLEYLGDAHVGYHHLDFPKFKLSVVGGRPFSCGGNQLFRNKLLKGRYGVRNMEESAERIYKAASGTPKENSIILLAHNGPKGLGSGNNDICGIDWESGGGDYGDPDLAQAIKQVKVESSSCRIPLVVFGHMHKELSCGGYRKMIAFDADNTMYLNAAIVPRVKSLSSGGSIRAFTVVEFSDGRITKVAETWVSIVHDKPPSLHEEHLLFINNSEIDKCTPSHNCN